MFAIKSNFGFYLLFLVCFLLSAAHAEECNPPNIRSSSGAWTICRQWTPAETRHYAKWIENIYLMKTKGTVEQRTAKLEGILSDPEMNLLQNPLFSGESANPQLSADIMRSMHYLMDCGTFTAFMPAYYAYRRALPWMTAVVTSGGGDIRTAAFTIPVESIDNFSSKSLDAFFKNAIGSFISGNYRVN
ncbi:MAG: hypothetical protein KAH38_08280, partial [Candidatus Hydrogenedentes bacterium]|nr:hypothetical protein [Candidatus Hydrogenedentota bacterium]